MFPSKAKQLTDLARVFLEPANPTHRQYEALRAFFVEKLSGAEVAKRYGYSPEEAFASWSTTSARIPNAPFFLPTAKGPRTPLPSRIPSVTSSSPSAKRTSPSTISAAPSTERASPSAPSSSPKILKDEGFATPPATPRRTTAAGLATRHGGRRRRPPTPISVPGTCGPSSEVCSLFLPTLGGRRHVRPHPSRDRPVGFAKMIPAGHAMRSLLALRLFGTAAARPRHERPSWTRDWRLFAGLQCHPQAARS